MTRYLSVGVLCAEAIAAVYRAIVLGLEGNLTFLAAFSANCVEHLALSTVFASCVLTGGTAVLAALRFICETLFGIKLLFTCSKSEFLSAFFAD